MANEKFEAGWKKLQQIDGHVGEAVISSLQDIAPDLGRHIIEFAFGEIYTRPALDLKQRQLITMSTLATQGGCEPQLRVHIEAALNVGLTPLEIVECFLHLSPYTGFPRVLNAVNVAKSIFAERKVSAVEPDQTAYALITMLDNPDEPEALAEYKRRATEIRDEYGAQVVLRMNAKEKLVGELEEVSVRVLKFPSKGHIRGWLNDPRYQAIIPLRERGYKKVTVTLLENL